MDKDLAIAQFVERFHEHAGKRVDNSAPIAGSPMHYYCRHCSAPTETLCETHRRPPVTICHPCRQLEELGLLPEAKRSLAQMDHEAFDRARSRLKLEMLYALGPDTCVQTQYSTREEILGLIKSGEADLLVSVATGRLSSVDKGEGTKHYAVRFNDRDLGERAREDCLNIYGLDAF